MTSCFIDLYLPANIRGFPWISAPRWSTQITGVASGDEHRNKNWKHPLRKFTSPEAVRCWDTIADLTDHWYVTAGPFSAFPMRDPLDFASVRLLGSNSLPDVVATDQPCGTGDGLAKVFQLKKTYTRGAIDYVRSVQLPIVDSVLVAIGGLPPETTSPALPGGPYTWEVDRLTGQITFDHPPLLNLAITAGYLFDVPVRFEADDSLEAMIQAWRVEGFSDLSFMETRLCAAGETS